MRIRIVGADEPVGMNRQRIGEDQGQHGVEGRRAPFSRYGRSAGDLRRHLPAGHEGSAHRDPPSRPVPARRNEYTRPAGSAYSSFSDVFSNPSSRSRIRVHSAASYISAWTITYVTPISLSRFTLASSGKDLSSR